MKKIIALALVILLVFSFAGCKKDEAPETTPNPTEQIESTEKTPEATTPEETAPTVTEKEEITEPAPTEPEFVFDGTANPIENELNPEQLPDGTYHIKIKNGGVASVDGVKPVSVNAILYNYDKYDVRELCWLDIGDKLIVDGKEIVVNDYNVTKMGIIMINGGLGQEGGYEFMEDADGNYFSFDNNDKKTFREVGPISIPVHENFTFTDSSDIEKEPIVYTLSDFTINDVYFEYAGGPDNAIIVIRDGFVVEMVIGYRP